MVRRSYAVLLLSLLAGRAAGTPTENTQEAPGEYFYKDGVRVKKYRGMASVEAMEKGGAKRYLYGDRGIRVAQGVSGLVVDKGSMLDLVPYIVQSLRQSLQDFGHRSIEGLHAAIDSGDLRYERRSSSAQHEGGVHGLVAYEEPVLGVRKEPQ